MEIDRVTEIAIEQMEFQHISEMDRRAILIKYFGFPDTPMPTYGEQLAIYEDLFSHVEPEDEL